MFKKLIKSNTSHFMKYLVVLFSWIFIAVGGLLIITGISMKDIYENYFRFLNTSYLSLPNGIMGFGGIILVVALCGYFGVTQYHNPSLMIFSSLTMLVLILEIALGVTGYVLRVRAADTVTKSMINSMKLYHNESHQIWDYTQEKLHCCGTWMSEDWILVFHNESLPMSCCTVERGTVGHKICSQNTTNKKVGCVVKILDIVKYHAFKITIIVVGIIISQIVAVVLSVILARNVKPDYVTVIST